MLSNLKKYQNFKKEITMNKKQKLAIASLIFLTSLNAFSDDLSMTLFSDVIQ